MGALSGRGRPRVGHIWARFRPRVGHIRPRDLAGLVREEEAHDGKG